MLVISIIWLFLSKKEFSLDIDKLVFKFSLSRKNISVKQEAEKYIDGEIIEKDKDKNEL